MNLRIAGTIAAAAAFAIQSPALAGVSTGQPAPDFTLTSAEGNQHSLSDFKGKYVVLEWINHGCPFVKKQYKSGNIQDLQERYGDKGVVWLSVCSSAPGKQGHMSAEDWQKKNEAVDSKATALLLDEDGKVGRAYGAKTTPHMYVIDPEGVLVYQGAIDDDRSANPDNLKNAENYVAAALDAAMAGKPVEKDTTKPYGCGVKY